MWVSQHVAKKVPNLVQLEGCARKVVVFVGKSLNEKTDVSGRMRCLFTRRRDLLCSLFLLECLHYFRVFVWVCERLFGENTSFPLTAIARWKQNKNQNRITTEQAWIGLKLQSNFMKNVVPRTRKPSRAWWPFWEACHTCESRSHVPFPNFCVLAFPWL